ncbi:MAG: hypothetical protein ACKOJF_15590, partial [Planctomycetaceae bacterium]
VGSGLVRETAGQIRTQNWPTRQRAARATWEQTPAGGDSHRPHFPPNEAISQVLPSRIERRGVLP